MTRLLSRKFLTMLVLAAGVLSVGAADADSPSCTSDREYVTGIKGKTYVYGPSQREASGKCLVLEGAKYIVFKREPLDGDFVAVGQRSSDGMKVVIYFASDVGSKQLPDWAIELVQNHRDEFRQVAPKQLALLEQKYPALAQGDSSSNAAARSSATVSPSDSTNAVGTNNSDAPSDISSQCRDTDRQTTRRYLGEANAAMQRGDMAAANRANLASSRAKLELYQGRCASASDARERIASANQGISMVVNLCNSAGLGSNCGGSSNSGSSASGQAYSGGSGSSGSANSSSGSSSSGSGTPEHAEQCITTARRSDGDLSMRNTCNFVIRVSWCSIGRDCKYGDWGYTKATSLRSGEVYDVVGSVGREVNFGACSPSNYIPESKSRTEYTCRPF